MMEADDLRLRVLNDLLRTLRAGSDVEYRSLIISIDFGTTYSGVAYLFTADLDRLHILDQWPGQENSKINSPKVPTVLRYGTTVQDFAWGYQVGLRDERKLEAFKLLLDPALPRPEYTQMMKVQKTFRESGKTPTNAVNDFMASLYRYAIAAIDEKHSQAYSEVLTTKFVISTPAGWPDGVKSSIMRAAQEVGISPVIHTTEPEAAASFALDTIEARNLKLKAGDSIMICDAGGATTDLTTYTIKRLHPLELVALVAPSTRPGGSLNLNKNFENHIARNLLEDEEFILLKKSPSFVDTMKQFDLHIKPVFSSLSTRQFPLKLKGTNLTDYPDGNLRNNIMTLEKRALEVIFLPVANTVSMSITEQLNAVKVKKVALRSNDYTSVDAVILTGGFGSSIYLREHLANKFPSLKFIQPKNTWTAVIRGAVKSQAPAKRLNETTYISPIPRLQNNRATRSYGIAYCPIWDANMHANENRYWDSWEGVWRCPDVNWIIKKGDDLWRKKKVSLPCYKQCPPNPEPDGFFIIAKLEQSSLPIPPTSSSHYSVSTCRTVKVPLDSIPDEAFQKKKRKSDKEPYWQLAYEVVLQVAKGEIAFWIQVDGNQFGSTVIKNNGWNMT